jgi:hypothetical protein
VRGRRQRAAAGRGEDERADMDTIREHGDVSLVWLSPESGWCDGAIPR